MTRPFSPDEARALVGACVADSFATYEVREYDAATEQFALLEQGRDAVEFVSAPKLLGHLAWGRWIVSVRQLTLAGLEGVR